MSIFNYRRKCIIHDTSLFAITEEGLAVDIVGDDLTLQILKSDVFRQKTSKNLNLTFHSDSTYTASEGIFNYLSPQLIIHMKCNKCNYICQNDTTLSNILTNQHFYSFKLNVGLNGKYSQSLLFESIKYTDLEKFYHIFSDLESKETTFKIGDCKLGMPVATMLERLAIIDVPSFDMSRIKSLDQFLNKVKTYMTFS